MIVRIDSVHELAQVTKFSPHLHPHVKRTYSTTAILSDTLCFLKLFIMYVKYSFVWVFLFNPCAQKSSDFKIGNQSQMNIFSSFNITIT